MDPRFAVEEPSDDGYARDSALPNVLTPGGHVNPMPTPGTYVEQNMPGGFPTTPAGGAQSPGGYGFPNQPQNRMPPPAHNPEYLHPKYISAGGMGSANESNSSPGEPSPISVDYDSHSPNEASSERASEASHFTSISERPVNPNWQPSASERGGPGSVAAQRRQQDVILGGNPDFSIPGVGAGRMRAGSRGATATAAYNPGVGMAAGGRYPA